MKFLKFKSFFFSLLAIAMATVFLTSCEEDVIVQETAPISDTELVNQLFDAVSQEMDYTADDINTKTKFDIVLGEEDLDQSIIEALSIETLELDENLIIQNSRELFCSKLDDCPTRGAVKIQKTESTLSDRDPTITIKVTIEKTGDEIKVSISIKIKFK